MKTLPDFDDLLRMFLDSPSLVSVAAFGSGHINDTYKVVVQDDSGQHLYLLQRVNHHVFRQPFAVTENINLVAQHLSQTAYPLKSLQPIATKNTSDGGWSVSFGEGVWRLFPFFENTVTFDKVETVEQAFEAAKAFGAFGKYLDGMDISKLKTTIPGFHDGVARLASFKEVLKKAIPERLAEAKKEVSEILDNQLIFNKIAGLNLPLRAVHHDTKINNLLFDEATLRPLVVVDLDTVMPGVVLSDFGDMMRTFTCGADEDEADLSEVAMRPSFFEAVYEGFLSEMGSVLTLAERQHLPEGGPWLTLMQALRFLGDYLEGDTYYKVKYPGHNLVRARNQLALFRSMRGQLEGPFSS